VNGLFFSNDEIIPENIIDYFDFSTWRYTTDPAEHNPGKFDLWVELDVEGKHFLIGNWSGAN